MLRSITLSFLVLSSTYRDVRKLITRWFQVQVLVGPLRRRRTGGDRGAGEKAGSQNGGDFGRILAAVRRQQFRYDATGNQSTQHNFSSDASYPRERWSAGASFNSSLAPSTGSSTTARNELTLNRQRLMGSKNWYYDDLGDFLQGSEKGVHLETFYVNWDGKPPTGFAASDYGATSGLGWTFGRK